MNFSNDRSIKIDGNAENAAIIGGDNNKVEINYYQNSPSLSRQRLPPLLPYLVNRSQQITQIRTSLDQRQEDSRPQLFIIYGDDQQSHDMLLKRIETKVLPEHFQQRAADLGITRYDVPWPENVGDISRLHEELTKYLTNTVHDSETHDRCYSIEDIHHRFKQCPGPVMLTTSVLDIVWRAHGAKCIELFLEFWNKWPLLNQKQQLLVFLSVKYVSSVQSPRQSILTRLFGARQVVQHRVTAEDVTEALEALTKRDWRQLIVRLLPKLDGVDRNEVENWAKSREVKKHRAISEELIRHIGEFFRENLASDNSGRIPMERIAEKLKQILQDDSIFEG